MIRAVSTARMTTRPTSRPVPTSPPNSTGPPGPSRGTPPRGRPAPRREGLYARRGATAGAAHRRRSTAPVGRVMVGGVTSRSTTRAQAPRGGGGGDGVEQGRVGRGGADEEQRDHQGDGSTIAPCTPPPKRSGGNGR